jgi:hypothetical protein
MTVFPARGRNPQRDWPWKVRRIRPDDALWVNERYRLWVLKKSIFLKTAEI